MLGKLDGCKVFTSVGDCDMEIARRAKELDYFAIMSDDTDHVIFNAAHYLFSCRDFDLGARYELSYTLEDFSELRGFPPAAKLFQPLRQRVYGILFRELVEGEYATTVPELCVYDLSGYKPGNVTPSPIPRSETYLILSTGGVRHPGLLNLWKDECNDRWPLFVKSVSETLDVDKIKSLYQDNKHYVVPTTALYLMKHEIAATDFSVDDWELYAFMIQAVDLSRYSVEDLGREPDPKPESKRVVHLSAIFGRAITTILLLMGAEFVQTHERGSEEIKAVLGKFGAGKSPTILLTFLVHSGSDMVV
uniref:XPG-I domain-containing protein n=1 Tax=Timema bartmani TaxID=61472 RepID=A0A7R9I3F8_9NEOP|nr:unnamed protein product [Timema bartmani]